MSEKKLKMQYYRDLFNRQGAMLAEVAKIPEEIGLPSELKGNMGLSGKISGRPAALRKDIREAMEEGAKKPLNLAAVVDELRIIVKEFYGDEYDAALTSTCEAALWMGFDILCSPPMGKGDAYQAYYLAPFERHMHHQAAYGRPFPPKYKDFVTDHGVTGGELGMLGKRQNNLSTVIVPLVGAQYDCHGIKYHPCPLMVHVDPDKSYERMVKLAERYAPSLVAITSLGYDSPGHGYGVKDSDGAPLMQKKYAQIAREYNVPYIVDNAAGTPFVGNDIRKIDADVMMYSMDKSTGSPICGLVIGKEEDIVPFRRALGTHSGRGGALAYGKAAYVGYEPGLESLVGAIAALKVLREKPEVVTQPLEITYEIVKEEVKALNPEIAEGLSVTKSYNRMEVEVNYQDTWRNGQIGFPIFSVEDLYAGTDMITRSLLTMGIISTVDYDGNISVSPGQGTVDENGQLIEERMRLCVRALFRAMELIWKYWQQ
jgi:hypothetical protein